MNNTSILIVCTANICRSPIAQGLLRHMFDVHNVGNQFQVESAGTYVGRGGDSPDPRACQVALGGGFDISDIRSRPVKANDFSTFDYILAVDRDNQQRLLEMCPDEYAHKLKLLAQFAPDLGIDEVPDPYYGNISGFERVFNMLECAARGLLEHLQRERLV